MLAWVRSRGWHLEKMLCTYDLTLLVTWSDWTNRSRMRKSINAAIAERRLLEVGLALIDKPTVIEDLANDANRARLAIDACTGDTSCA